MKQLIAKYKAYVEAGYGREELKEMLQREKSLSEVDINFILETVFKKK